MTVRISEAETDLTELLHLADPDQARLDLHRVCSGLKMVILVYYQLLIGQLIFHIQPIKETSPSKNDLTMPVL